MTGATGIPPTTPAAKQDQTSSSSTPTTGSDSRRDQQDRSGQSEGLAETASQYSRDVGRRASEVYEQGRQAAGQAWDTARRTADQVRRQGSQGLSSVQPMLRDNPLAGIMVGAAVGVLVGYLIGHATASASTTRTRRYNDRDEFADSGHYTGGYHSYGSSARGSVRYSDDDFAESGHYADPNRYADRN